MTASRWRIAAVKAINEVRQNNPNAAPDELRKLISKAYPFGARKYHPYKIWLDEVRVALGGNRKTPPVRRGSVMPGMEQWAKERGLA